MSCASTRSTCPICSDQMQPEYVDGSLFAVRCPECFFNIVVAHLGNEEIAEERCQDHLRWMLHIIARGERFKDIINDLPFFPGNRAEQIMALMSSTIPRRHRASHLDQIVQSPLTDEDQALVKAALALE